MIKRSNIFKKDLLIKLSALSLLLYFISFNTVCTPKSIKKIKAAKEELSELQAIKIIREEKSKAEEYAKILKLYCPEGSEKYKPGRELYAKAKAAFDGWIDQFIFDLRYSKYFGKSEQYRKTLEVAVDKSLRFITYVRDLDMDILELKKMGFPGVGESLEIITKLYEAGRAIWEMFFKGKEEDKENIIKELESLKMRSFDELSP